MSTELTELWQSFFGPSDDGSVGSKAHFLLLRRGGRPFLLLPQEPALAAKALDLYAAQSRAARAAKAALRLGLQMRLPLGLEAVALNLPRKEAFVAYLSQVAAAEQQYHSAPMALLAGNPRTEGRRCVFLLFNPHGQPAAVVKAGAGPEAITLIEGETRFLQAAPHGISGIPPLRSAFQSDRVCALELEFFSGSSPRARDWPAAENTLSAWIHAQQKMRVTDFTVWQRLQAAPGPILPAPVRDLAARELRPTIFHGDFAPWNIKVRQGAWCLVDWERGEMSGLPLWDWLHFIIQPAILVEQASPDSILGRVERFFESAPLARYAERAGLRGHERPLCLAYLHYSIRVLRPSEGLSQLQALADAALQSWFSSKPLPGPAAL